jgi:restriction endonuclease S subunit
MPQISIVKLSEVEKDGRFDAEFYKPEYLEVEKKTRNSLFTFFRNLKLKVDASAFYPSIESYYNKGEIPFLRVKDVDTQIDYTNSLTLPKEVIDINKNIRVAKEGDIVITKGGSVARIGFISKKSALSRDLIFINTSKLREEDRKFIFFYLISDFSNKLILKTASLTAQPHLTIKLIRELPVFFPNEKIRNKISKLFDDSHSKLQTSKSLYKEAEEILLKELGLLDYKPKHELTFSSKLSEAIDAERIDADYFQPKYKEIEKKIEGYKGGFFTLSDEEIINKNFFPKPDKEYCYIELSNVSGNGEINGFTKDLGVNLPTRARRKLKEGDVIISTIEGSLNSCALITKDYENCLCSNGFFVLNSNKLNPETLLVLAKSLIIQKLLERGCRGTILTAIGKNELQKIKIPLLPSPIQNKISSKIQESSKLRKESKELLEKAKKMVEDEIEREAK